MSNTTKSWKKYVDEWDSYISPIGMLRMTPSMELSKEVGETIDKLKMLVRRVADDKKLHKAQRLKEVI